MYDKDSENLVKEEVQEERDKGETINRMAYKAGRQIRVLEFIDNKPTKGGKSHNEKGRGSETTPEQKAKNRKKTRRKQKQAFIDCIDANVDDWTAFDTPSYADIVTDPQTIIDDMDVFLKFVTFWVRKRGDCAFVPKYAWIYAFQDGKRRYDKQGRFSLHGHCFNNFPYWEVQVIVIEDAFAKKGERKNQRYVLKDGTLSKIATRETLFFDGGFTREEHDTARKEGAKYLREHIAGLRAIAGPGKRIRLKKLPFYTVAWGKGHYHRRWFKQAAKNARKEERSTGEYAAAHYALSDSDRDKLTPEQQEKFEGRKGWYHSHFRTTKDGVEKHPGGLERVQTFYNSEVDQLLDDAGAWDCLTSGKSFYVGENKECPKQDEFEVGWIVMYRFNLDAKQYPAISTIAPDDRDSLKLDDDVKYMTLFVDEEIERRKRLAEWETLQGRVPAPDPKPAPEQQDLWFLPSASYAGLFAT